LEEPPNDSLLLLLTDMPEALPETILSRCIAIPLAPDGEPERTDQQQKLVKLLQQAARQESWTIQPAYQLAQDFQGLLRELREAVKDETDEALKQEQVRYRDATDGAWLDEREEYYKALTESLYLEQRGGLIETLFAWWTDVLRAKNGVVSRNIVDVAKETTGLAARFRTTEILKRLRCLEELRDQLGRNIHEALAIEVAFLTIFTG
jgi:DNA polymerase-3 subunit delta'